ncbi:zinc finger BED domain-containing protein 4-like [Eurosta solidaginis]|uniref:zinc finger BED domain-containing protein 4-like n=1 Tax=Eurosta solidaginis TaxID=178769 RepID=UPI0035307DF2
MYEWEISNKITAVVSDNAPNIIAAIKLGGWRSVPYFAHTLNLIVQKALLEIDNIKTKSKAIVEFFHRSTSGLQKLKETQKQLNLPELKLKIDVQTRWNSTYEMFDRLLKIKDASAVFLPRTKPDLCMTQQDWDAIEEIIPVLKPFYEVTVELSAEQNVTLSKVLIICKILKKLIAAVVSTSEVVRGVFRVLQSEMLTRFSKIETNFVYAESTILDPRFKRHGFKNEDAYKKALDDFKKKFASMQQTESTTVQEVKIFQQNVGTVQPGQSIWDEYDSEFALITSSTNKTVAATRELDKYLKEEYISRGNDPLK